MAGVRESSLLQNVQTGCGGHLVTYSLGAGVLSLGIKQREFDHSPPYSCTPHYAFMTRTVTPVPFYKLKTVLR
jgi:hypothetical protein